MCQRKKTQVKKKTEVRNWWFKFWGWKNKLLLQEFPVGFCDFNVHLEAPHTATAPWNCLLLLNSGHFVAVWCVFIGTIGLHFKTSLWSGFWNCCCWVSQAFMFSSAAVTCEYICRLFLLWLSFKLISACCAGRTPHSKTIFKYNCKCNYGVSTLIPLSGYLNYNLWFQRLYQSTFSEVFPQPWFLFQRNYWC